MYRLIGECRELGVDPLAWRVHLSEGASGLTGAVAGISTEAEGFFHQADFRVRCVVHTGFDDAARRLHQLYLAEQGFHTIDQPFEQFVRRHRTLTTCTHEQLIQPAQWRTSVLFNKYFRPCRFDDRLLSGYRFRLPPGVGPNSHDCLVLMRALGDRPFTRRDRRLVRLLHREVAPMIGRQLASADEPSATQLSPRRRQVLDCLLEGDSEKQVAARLGLSRQTVHQYVKVIYRHFRVGGRAELMARWIRYDRGGRAPSNKQQRLRQPPDDPARLSSRRSSMSFGAPTSGSSAVYPLGKVNTNPPPNSAGP